MYYLLGANDWMSGQKNTDLYDCYQFCCALHILWTSSELCIGCYCTTNLDIGAGELATTGDDDYSSGDGRRTSAQEEAQVHEGGRLAGDRRAIRNVRK